MPRRAIAIAAGCAALAALLAPAPASAAPADCSAHPWMDRHRSADQRARALLDASSLDQKLRWLNEQAANNPQQTLINYSDPAGPVGNVAGQVAMPAQVPCTPTIQYADGPASVNAGTGVTAFPVPVALAASWDTGLAEVKGSAQADEAWRKQRTVLLAPGLASGRDPRAGRTSEYLGEDQLLGGLMAAAGSRGINGNPRQPVESVVKHFVANEQETDRQASSSNVDQRALREIYTLPFEIAVRRGAVDGVMCSYNQVNGAYACGSDTLLRRILKTEIGFDGFVMTDFGAVHSLAAEPPSLRAGLDQELNAWRYWNPDALKAALAAGRITAADVDRAAFRVVRSHINAGLFDAARPATAEPVVTTAAHKAVARQVAERGSVLLKNDRILPLSDKPRKIAVIGPTASGTPTNGISAASVCSYGIRFASNCAPVAPLESIRQRAAAGGGTVTFNDGSDPAAAAAAARDADVAVVFGYYREGEFADRPNLSLDGNGDALIAAVAAANRNTVVVLQTGGPVLMPWLRSVRGVLQTWYAGEQMGPATAALLWGDATPTGKLPYTFPRSEVDLPTAGSPEQYPGVVPAGGTVRQVEFTEGLKVGYRWYAAEGIRPLFPFGYGLSYTTFDYSRLNVTRHAGGIRIAFRLTNIGHRTGTETAQAYVQLPAAAKEPSKRLAGWRQVTLAPGRSRDVVITLTAADLADLYLLQHWDAAAQRWRTADGAYRFTVGGSFDTTLAGTIHIGGNH